MIWDRVSGDPATTGLPHRILNLLVFLGLVQALFFLVSDSLVGQVPLSLVLDLGMIAFFSLLWWQVRFRGRFVLGNHLFAVAGLFLPQVNFFVNAGIDGPGLMVILGIAVLLLTLHPGRTGIVYSAAALVLALADIVIQALQPGWVLGYRNSTIRYLDIGFTFLICLVLLFVVVRMVLRFHAETLERSKQLDAAAAQSERMAALGELIAGVGHEIGTPAAIIGSTLALTKDWWRDELPRFRPLWSRLSPAQKEAFWSLFETGLQVAGGPPLDSRSSRARREFLAAQLPDLGLGVRRTVAEDLVSLDLKGWDPRWDPLTVDALGWEAWRFVVKALSLDRSNHMAAKAYERLLGLISALGAYARSGHPEDPPVLTVVSEGLDTVLTLYTSAHKARVEIVRRYAEVPPVLAKPEELVQVWTNLVQNALQAMHHRGTLTIGLEAREPWVVVTVDDTGPGVPPEIRDKIFQLFYTTKKRGAGTGLGLGIVQKIVVAHGGKIVVGDAPGGGARFEVFLPVPILRP